MRGRFIFGEEGKRKRELVMESGNIPLNEYSNSLI